MKTLVVFIGQSRTIASTRAALFRMFEKSAGVVEYVFMSLKDHYGVCSVAFNVQPVSVRDFDLPWELVNYPKSTLLDAKKKKAVNEQLSSYVEAAQYVEERKKEFDWVVRCRPDLAVIEPMEELKGLEADRLYFPTHNNWGGLNDRFWFGPTELMITSFKWPYLVKSVLRMTSHKLNMERMLARSLGLQGVPVCRTKAVLSPLRYEGVMDEPVYREDRGDKRGDCDSAWKLRAEGAV